MARPHYPSDEKRKKERPHVKVHLSWPTHPRYGWVYADRELRSVVLGIWTVAFRAHAGATDNRVTMGPAQMMEAAGCRRPDQARRWIERACSAMEWEIRSDRADTVSIKVRNFARKQIFSSAARGATPHDSAPSDSDTDSDNRKQIPSTESEGVHTSPPDGGAPANGFALDPDPPTNGRAKKSDPIDEAARAAFPAVRQAFGLYGKFLDREPAEGHLALIRALVRKGRTTVDLVHAVHGYAWKHRKPGRDFDPDTHRSPKTIFRPSNIDDYLEHWNASQLAGREPPFMPE